MSRQFNARNVERPAGVERILAQAPRCFDAHIWALYLAECWRESLNDAAARRRLERGELPAFCEDCTAGHMQRMQAAGRCHPPRPAQVITEAKTSLSPSV